jgi:uncharacterized membrane protein YciS (DUF1049 family)
MFGLIVAILGLGILMVISIIVDFTLANQQDSETNKNLLIMSGVFTICGLVGILALGGWIYNLHQNIKLKQVFIKDARNKGYDPNTIRIATDIDRVETFDVI